jgi:hypothetical protein
VDVGPLVIANAQAAKLVQPRERALHDPAPPAQATPVRGAAHGQPGHDVPRPQARAESPPHRSRESPSTQVRMPPRPPMLALEWGNRIDQSQRFLRVVPMGSRQPNREWHAAPVANQMTLAPALGSVRGIGARSGRPRTLRGRSNYRQQPATNQSGRDARANRAARSASDPNCRPLANRATAASTSSRSAPEFLRSICQGMPLRRTKTMPVRHARSGRAAFRPLAVAGGIGRNGSTRSHNGSEAARWPYLFTLPRRHGFQRL